jgi:hypothetical protein
MRMTKDKLYMDRATTLSGNSALKIKSCHHEVLFLEIHTGEGGYVGVELYILTESKVQVPICNPVAFCKP